MATFRVGQRVRVVRSQYGITAGREATIIGKMRMGRDLDGSWYAGWPLDIDGWGPINVYGVQIVAPPQDIEPITPERNRVVAWDSLPIDPRKILEEA